MLDAFNTQINDYFISLTTVIQVYDIQMVVQSYGYQNTNKNWLLKGFKSNVQDGKYLGDLTQGFYVASFEGMELVAPLEVPVVFGASETIVKCPTGYFIDSIIRS